jgi:hypothetical protein
MTSPQSSPAAGAAAAHVPVPGVDPRVPLAATLHATGTTAVLLGSGISSSAGILTGWQVTLDLIRKVAAVEGVPAAEVGDRPELWWAARGRGEPRYDDLLKAVAPTDADRQVRLREYFDPVRPDGTAVEPTPAHRAVARLAARGSVPVIVTTNFDRLLERALVEQGVDPQVVADPTGVRGMTPLRHAKVTVVKIHGDYAGGRMRNAPDELDRYPRPWNTLLREIFDQYGLLVVGWSAEYDRALARAVAAAAGRRYAWYWASYRGQMAEDAARLVNSRGAHPISTTGADELMNDLVDKVGSLDRLAARRRQSRATAYLYPLRGRPQGLDVLPLAMLRAVAVLSPVVPEMTGDMGPETRERIRDALTAAPLTATLAELAASTDPAHAGVHAHPGSPAPTGFRLLEGWRPAPGGHHTGSDAAYLLGRDGSAGIVAVCTITLANQLQGQQAHVALDIGMSVVGGVAMDATAPVLRDAVHAVGSVLVDALDDVLPAESQVARAEVHFDVPGSDGNLNRPVPPGSGLRYDAFGPPTRAHAMQTGYAELVDGPVDAAWAGGFVIRALRKIALDSGYLDPRPALEQVVAVLDSTGHPSASSAPRGVTALWHGGTAPPLVDSSREP